MVFDLTNLYFDAIIVAFYFFKGRVISNLYIASNKVCWLDTCLHKLQASNPKHKKTPDHC